MYIFPYPEDSDIAPIQVPYFDKYQYDISLPNAFAVFPYRCGFQNPSDPRRIDLTQPPLELAAFLQSWLFFGLMSEVIGKPVDRLNYVKSPTGPSSLDEGGTIDIRIDDTFDHATRNRAWEIKALEFHKQKAIRKALDISIRIAEENVSVIDKDSSLKNTAVTQVVSLIRMLLFYLTRQKNHPDYDANSFWMLISRMHQKGWCPQRIKIVREKKFSYPALYYLSSLGRHMPSHISHRHCFEDGCSVKADDLALRVPYHRKEGCRCASIGAPMTTIIEIISQGGVPLLRAHQGHRGNMELDIVKCTSFSNYTAISHIWSDLQLGNNLNTLPQCQLEYLTGLLSKLPPKSGRSLRSFQRLHNYARGVIWKIFRFKVSSNQECLFWLDTLCIPSGEEHKILRRKSINMMDLIFSGANQVLVLDAELQQIQGGQEALMVVADGLFGSRNAFRFANVPAYENLVVIAAHIFCCNWMGRAWTLQEGALARECVFQLADSSISLSKIDFHAYLNYPLLKSTELYVYMLAFMRSRSEWKRWAKWVFQSPATSLGKLFSSLLVLIYFMIQVLISRVFPRIFDTTRERLQSRTAPPMFIHESLSAEFSSAIESLADVKVSKRAFEDGGGRDLKDAWNSLLGRATTKKEDLHVIIANLAGLNGGLITQSEDAGQRMRSILFSLDGLPMDLLFLNCPKFQGGSGHRDRWIPLMPSGRKLQGDGSMTFSNEGLILEIGNSVSVTVLMLAAQTQRSSRLRLSAKLFTDARQHKHASLDCWVEAYAPHDDELPPIPDGETCIILEPGDPEGESFVSTEATMRGARFIVRREEGDKIFLQYDCSLHAVRSARPPPSWNVADHSEPWTECQTRRFPLEKTLVLETSVADQDIFPMRPTNPFYHAEPSVTLIAVLGSLVIFMLEIALLVVVRKIVGIQYDKLGIENSASATGTALLVLIFLFCGLQFQYHVLRYILQTLGYYAWAASFNENWEPEGQWRWWYKLLRLAPWLRSQLRAWNSSSSSETPWKRPLYATEERPWETDHFTRSI